MIAAIERVGEIALLRVLQQGGEEIAQLWLNADFTLLQGGQRQILRGGVQHRKIRSVLHVTPRVKRRDAFAVDLRGVQRRLPATQRIGGRIMRAQHVPVIRTPVIPGQLAVDEDGHAGLDRAGTVTIRGDQPRGGGKDEGPFLGGEIFRLVFVQRGRCSGGLRLCRGCDASQRHRGGGGFQKAAAAGKSGGFSHPVLLPFGWDSVTLS